MVSQKAEPKRQKDKRMGSEFPVFNGEPAPNKSCGSCSLCCKVYDVPWLDKPKPAGKWCHHCSPGKGCAIWQSRPEKCADYHCLWRLDPVMAEEWRPSTAKFLMNRVADGMPFVLMVDPNFPQSFRKEPYYSALKKASLTCINNKTFLIAYVGEQRYLIMPDGDIAIPPDRSEAQIEIYRVPQPDGSFRWDAKFPLAKAA